MDTQYQKYKSWHQKQTRERRSESIYFICKVINRLKLDCYIYKIFQVSLRLTAKQEPIIDKEKGIKAYHYGKIISFKGRHQEMKKSTKQENYIVVLSY